MSIEDFIRIVREVEEDFQREQDQSVMQRDMHKAEMALAGKDACNRILRAVESRTGLVVVAPRRTGRAR